MAIPVLSIRNISTTPLELKLLERFESAEEKGGVNITKITRTFSGFMSNITSPTSPQLAQKAESFSHQDVSIPIASFETKTTDIQPKEKENLRLTFEINGERYRVDTPTPNQRSTVLKPLSHNPSYEFTAVYLPKFSFLTIFSSTKLNSWMSNLKDETPLAALSIPGTHNSPTYHTALPSVRCQAVSVKDQLNNGIRFLDIRVQPSDPNNPNEEGLILVHSAFPVSLTGNKYFRRDLVQHINKFLDDNPTETIIMSVKREGVGKATDQQLSKILHKHYATDLARWFTENRIPTLGEARGKIVMIRRFGLDDSLKGENNGTGFCIDAESWPDNCADGTCSSGEIRVQDFYEVAESVNIEKKIKLSTDQLERAAKAVAVLPGDMAAASAESAKQPLFVNFLSASNFWRANCWPDRIAAKVNPSVTEFLCRKHNESTSTDYPEGASIGDGSTGIVVCDWVGIDGDWDLVRCILAMNAKLELREKEPPKEEHVSKEEDAPEMNGVPVEKAAQEEKDAPEENDTLVEDDTPIEKVALEGNCAPGTDTLEEKNVPA
ncbi:phosphatidylinositol-specific phospholipase c protein [Rutstroemia sp. NJR-2017a BVV2]|nr:phosphatidylinositol-specific phospholipase c protein [Rutstroemia sp. NJR-2017a BVV2]